MGSVQPRIFISHSSRDLPFVRKLADDLQHALGNEWTIWYDAHLKGGQQWWRKIVEELHRSTIFLVVCSPAAMTSEWVNDEIDLAWRLKNSSVKMQIIPLLYQPCQLRYDLENLQFVHFLVPRPYQNGLQELLQTLSISPDILEQCVSDPPPPLVPVARSVTRISRRRLLQGGLIGTLLVAAVWEGLATYGTSFGTHTTVVTPRSFQAKTVKTVVQNGGFSCQYSRKHDRLYLAQYWNQIAVVENVTSSHPNYRVLGTGYVHPAGIAVTSDEKTLYLTDNGTDPKVDGLTDKQGRLLRVDLTSSNGGNRDQATLLYSAQKAFNQITLDEARGDIYFVTAKVGNPNDIQTYTGSLMRFHLETGEATVLADNLVVPFGFLLSSDHQTAYTIEAKVPGQGVDLIRYDLMQGKREILWASTGQNLFCAWGNASESAVIVPNRSHGVVWYIDVSKTPAEAYQIADLSLLPSVPNSTARLTDELFPLLVNTDSTISILDQ